MGIWRGSLNDQIQAAELSCILQDCIRCLQSPCLICRSADLGEPRLSDQSLAKGINFYMDGSRVNFNPAAGK